MQYLAWVGKLLSGDLGRSIISRQPAWDVLVPRILPTAQIGLTAWVLATLIAVPVGIVSAIQQRTWRDWLGTIGSLVGAAMPYFLTGGLLIYVVAMRWRLLPASGYVSPFVDPLDSVKTTILPRSDTRPLARLDPHPARPAPASSTCSSTPTSGRLAPRAWAKEAWCWGTPSRTPSCRW